MTTEPEEKLDERKTELVKTLGSRTGHAILTTDRLIFGESSMLAYTPLGLVASSTRSGEKKAKKGGKGSVEIPLGQITSFKRVRATMQNNGLEIEAAGAHYKFAFLYDVWAPTIADLLARRYGRTVTPTGDGFTVS
jgi:hypothetical protein